MSKYIKNGNMSPVKVLDANEIYSGIFDRWYILFELVIDTSFGLLGV